MIRAVLNEPYAAITDPDLRRATHTYAGAVGRLNGEQYPASKPFVGNPWHAQDPCCAVRASNCADVVSLVETRSLR